MIRQLKIAYRNVLSPSATGVALAISLVFGGASAETRGHFEGNLEFRPLEDGRIMQLLRPFKYVDSHGVDWPVPAGTKVDGASIPRVFWSILGWTPYIGKYRDASVIHDYYCQTHLRHWRAVHRVFYDGMLARKVDPIQAKIMYLAVYRFGPRWDYDADACFCKGCPACANPKIRKIKSYQSKYKESDFEILKSKMKSDLSIEELEDLADYQINSEIFSK
jgi:hypothetical protein